MSAAAIPAAHRPVPAGPPARRVPITRSALIGLTRAEFRLFRRDPASAFFSIAFPAILVAVLGSVPSFRRPSDDLHGARVIDLYVPIAIGFVLAMLALNALPVYLAGYREKGVLRRFATTPVHPATVLAAQMLVAVATATATSVLILGIGRIFFDVALPGQPAGFVLAFLLAAASLLAIGTFVAAVVPTGRAGNAVGTVLFFPLMFFAGLWVPRDSMPDPLRQISDFTPLGAGVQALRDSSAGAWPHPLHLVVMAAYLLVFATAAARLFRWE